MTLLVDWRIKIGTVSPTDFSSRVMGLSLDQRLQWMAPATQTLTLTIDNHDGALTPDEIGGNGTYKTTNWFDQAVFVEVGVTNSLNVTTYYDVFHGLIDGFDLVDNGQSSMVTLTAVDWLTIAGRTKPALGWSGDENLIDAAFWFFDYLSILGDLPSFGDPVQSVTVRDLTDKVADERAGIVLNGSFLSLTGTVADVLTNQILSSGISLIFGDTILISSGPDVTYRVRMVGNTLNRRVTGSPINDAITFDLTAKTTAANKLDFTAVEYGFAVDNLLNEAEVSNGTNTATYRNTASITAYGASTFSATETTNATLASCQAQAQAVAQRFGQVYYRPIRVSMSSANLRKSHDDSCDDFGNLLSYNGLWQRLDLTATPTGGTSKTTNHMIMGRTINATPGETIVDLFLVGRNQFQSFILDTSKLDFERIA